MVKNINSVHRVEGINSQFGLQGALAASKVDVPANRSNGIASNVAEKIADTINN